MNKPHTNTWLVTGTSQGLGLELTNLLLDRGHRVIATSRTPEKTTAALGERDNLYAAALDLTSDADVRRLVDAGAKRFGGIDVVVNNAGYSLVGSMEETSDAEFRAALDVNLVGPVSVIRHVLPYMRRQGRGRIINISSNAGYVGFGGAASYNAAKFGLVGVTEALAQEVRDFGIHATVVAPGQFRTEFMDSLHYVERRVAGYGTDAAQSQWSAYSGKQNGDPRKLVEILLRLSELPEPPLHLLLGPDTYQLVTDHRAREAKEIARWKDWTLSTDFDAAP